MSSASLARANAIAASNHRLEKRRLIHDQTQQLERKRDQVVKLFEAGLYDKSEALKRLKKIEDEEDSLKRTIKRSRVRSPSPDIASLNSSSPMKPSSPIPRHSSPVWDIENPNASINSDDIDL